MICRISVCEKYNFQANLFGYHFLDQYKYKYILEYLNSVNVNINMIIQTDIWKPKNTNMNTFRTK